MKRTGFALALAALLVMPAAAPAKPTKADTKAASKECHALVEAAVSKANLQSLGFKNLGDCVSQKAHEEARERKAARRQARAECEGLKGRERKQCVRTETKQNKAKKDAKDQARIEAASTCAGEQEELGAEAFVEKYGGKERGAFRKCVAATMKAQRNES